MTPRILILSFYYRPDLSAGSFRTTALVDALRAALPNAVMDVVTSLPNRYRSFSSQAPEQETDGLTTIRRIALPPHRSGMSDQAKAYLRFASAASRFVGGRHYDLVYATSSRLMTAALGAWLAGRLRAPLYLDIRDIFVDTMKDVLPAKVAAPIKPLLSLLERWTISRATHVNLVSPGFAAYFEARYPRQSFSYFTNGIDDEFLPEHAGPSTCGAIAGRAVLVVYAGNMGEGQGLHEVVPQLAQLLGPRIRFKLIGDGGRRSQLEKAIAAAGVTNVEVVAPMSRDALIREYMAADVLFLHLNAYEAFKKVLPSKIFEYAALGKPVWAGVSGYAATFLNEEVDNAAVFAPCDAAEGAAAFERLALRDSPRGDFIRKYSRRAITRDLAADVTARMLAQPR